MRLKVEGNFPFGRLLATVLAIGAGLGGPAFVATGLAHAESKGASMVIDANTGEVLHADRGDEPRYPASLTKMMTLYLVFEAIEQGRITYGSKIKVSQEAASAAPTKLDLEPGEQIAVIDAVKSLITKSANDMAVALAEALAGTEQRFAELMTAKARQIGMLRTTFRNASGLPDPGQVTTARDMLMLGLRLQDDFPKHYPMFSTRAFSYNGSTHRNHNTLLGSLEGIDGIKTGYTRMSGFNVVTSYRRGDKHLVGTVFGGLTAGTRNTHMRFLLARALFKASSQRTRRAPPVLVARARPAVRPERAEQPAVPKVAARAEAWPQASVRPVPKPAAAPAAPAQARPAEAAAAPAEPQPTAPVVQIARVRSVMVAQRVRPAAVAAVPADGLAQGAAAEVDAVRSPAPMQSAEAAPPAAAPAARNAVSTFAAPRLLSGDAATPMRDPVRPPSTLDRQVAQLIETPPAGSVPPVQPVPSAAAPARASPATAAATPPMRVAAAPATGIAAKGAPPSTLQQQAESLARGGGAAPAPTQAAKPIVVARADTTPTFRLRGPEAAAVAAAAALPGVAGDFQIQIGAFATAAEAERAIATTRERAADVLGSFAPLTTPVQKPDRQLFRARFAGFDAKTAAAACLELRRRQIDCFVMRP